MTKPLPLNKNKVLIVDDARPPRKVLKKLLSEFGSINFLEAETINEAQTILAKEDISLIFCDHNLPDAKSISLLGWLNKNNKKIPTIIISSDLDKETVIEGRKQGAVNFLVKPFNMSDLLNILSSSLKWDENISGFYRHK